MRAPDFFDELNEFLGNFDIDRFTNDQDNFVLYMEIARNLSWDLPSVLGCTDLKKEIPMHRESMDDDQWNDYFEKWEDIDKHYKEIHGLDLTDSRINWSFDT